MKFEIHTLYWDNSDKEMIQAHKNVMHHFGFPVNYYENNIQHGNWMDQVCKFSQADVICFLDGDCVPVNLRKFIDCIQHVQKTKTFLGVAQVSNHIQPKAHIYAAPPFFVIHKECWANLAVSFKETYRSDVAEELSYTAESKGVRYKCLYPTTFEREPVEGVWPLGNYGYYGIGTTFENTVYHLYQGRMGNNVQLFVERCNDIIEGKFSNQDHINSKTMNYKGRVVS